MEEECEFVISILEELEFAGADMLSPLGILLFDLPDGLNKINKSLEDTPNEPDLAPTSSGDAEIQVKVEDSLGELDNGNKAREPTHQISTKNFIINGFKMSKAWTLSKYRKTRKFVSLTDCLK